MSCRIKALHPSACVLGALGLSARAALRTDPACGAAAGLVRIVERTSPAGMPTLEILAQQPSEPLAEGAAAPRARSSRALSKQTLLSADHVAFATDIQHWQTAVFATLFT